jgi:aconitase A
MASGATATLRAGDRTLSYAPLASVDGVERLPYSLRILLENALRAGSESGVEAVAQWEPRAEPSRELGFRGTSAEYINPSVTHDRLFAARYELYALRAGVRSLIKLPRKVFGGENDVAFGQLVICVIGLRL